MIVSQQATISQNSELWKNLPPNNLEPVLSKTQENLPKEYKKAQIEISNNSKDKKLGEETVENLENLTNLEKSNNLESSELQTILTSASYSNSRPFQSNIFLQYSSIVWKAVKEKKTFIVIGNFKTIRSALLKRGWLEKIIYGSSKYERDIINLSNDELIKNVKQGNYHESVLISKLMDTHPAYFIWQPRFHKDVYDNVTPLRNRIRREYLLNDFTRKDGLLNCIENYHWHYIDDGVTNIYALKCLKLDFPDGIEEFQKVFRLTYCLSFLRFLSEKFVEDDFYTNDGDVEDIVIQFAINRVQEAIDERNHEDIDGERKVDIDDEKWNDFIQICDKMIVDRKRFRNVNSQLRNSHLIKLIEGVLTKAKTFWPTIHMDGYLNLWIMKPANKSRGNGIVISRKYLNIIDRVKRNKKINFVIQKYIEIPLLIYKTKFDIRQHILVQIINNSIQLWFYKECCLRFSSTEFSLQNLNEQIHLTNNSIQKKYKNGSRSELLPRNNMWSLEQFRKYLNKNDKTEIWDKKIYPNMKGIIIAVLLASLDDIELKHNTFELYGCDFMLDENYNPILIEINSAPDMTASTSVTAKLCPEVLEDVIKIVVDVPLNPNASIGNFELVYKISWENFQSTHSPDMILNGQKMILHDPESIKPEPEVMKSNNKGNSRIRKKPLNNKLTRIIKIDASGANHVTESVINTDSLKTSEKVKKSKTNKSSKILRSKSNSRDKNIKRNTKNFNDSKPLILHNHSSHLVEQNNKNTVSSSLDIVKKSINIIKTLHLLNTEDSITTCFINAMSQFYEKNQNRTNNKKALLEGHELSSNIKQALAFKFESNLSGSQNHRNDEIILREFLNILCIKILN